MEERFRKLEKIHNQWLIQQQTLQGKRPIDGATSSQEATLLNKALYNNTASTVNANANTVTIQTRLDNSNSSSNKSDEREVLINQTSTELSAVNKILANNHTEPCDKQGKLIPKFQREFDREIIDVNAFIERAIHCTTLMESRRVLLNTLVSPNGQEQILNIINSTVDDYKKEIHQLELVPTQVIYDHVKAYINARANNINSSETDTERVQTDAKRMLGINTTTTRPVTGQDHGQTEWWLVKKYKL